MSIYEQARDSKQLVELLKKDEEELVFTEFSSDVAFALGLALRRLFNEPKFANDGHSGIAFSITLFNGLVLFQATAGTGVSPDNIEWLKRKSNTVRRFGVGSWLRGQSRIAQGKSADDPTLGPDYAAHGGAFPINIRGMESGPIGVLAVSGLTQALDHDLAVSAIRVYLQTHETL